MAGKDGNLKLTAKDVAQCFIDPLWSTRYPPILTVDQVSQLLQIPRQTIYDWSSRGLLQGCGRKVGKHLRFFRDRLILHVFTDGLNTHGK